MSAIAEIAITTGNARERENQGDTARAAIESFYNNVHPWILQGELFEESTQRALAQHEVSTALAQDLVFTELKVQAGIGVDNRVICSPEELIIRRSQEGYLFDKGIRAGLDPVNARRDALDAVGDAVSAYLNENRSLFVYEKEHKALATLGADLLAHHSVKALDFRLGLLWEQSGKGGFFEKEMQGLNSLIYDAVSLIQTGGSAEQVQQEIARVTRALNELLFSSQKVQEFFHNLGIQVYEMQVFHGAIGEYLFHRMSFGAKLGQAAGAFHIKDAFFPKGPKGPRRPNWPLIFTYLGLGSLVLASCAPPPPSAPVNPEPTPTLPPSPTHVPEATIGSPLSYGGSTSVEVLNVQGAPVGIGGSETSIIPHVLTQALRDKLNSLGYAPVVDNNGWVAQIVEYGGVSICVFNTPNKLFNPDLPGGEEADLGVKNGVKGYGDSGGVPGWGPDDLARSVAVTAVSLAGMPDGYSCISAVVTDPKNPGGEGAVRILLLDPSGKIIAEVPGIFSADTNIKVLWGDKGPRVFVNGEELVLQLPPTLETATSTETIAPPTATLVPPTATELPTETLVPPTETLVPPTKVVVPTVVLPPPPTPTTIIEPSPTLPPPPAEGYMPKKGEVPPLNMLGSCMDPMGGALRPPHKDDNNETYGGPFMGYTGTVVNINTTEGVMSIDLSNYDRIDLQGYVIRPDGSKDGPQWASLPYALSDVLAVLRVGSSYISMGSYQKGPWGIHIFCVVSE